MSRPAPEVSPQAWQEFIAAHSDGGVLHGKVVSVVPFGAFVECAAYPHSRPVPGSPGKVPSPARS
jgi:hypothetical protein